MPRVPGWKGEPPGAYTTGGTMAFQAVPFTAEVRYSFAQDLNDRLMQCILYYRRNAGWDVTSLTALMTQSVNSFGAVMTDQYPESCRLSGLEVRDLSTEFGLQLDASALLPVVGANTGEFASPNNAALVRFIANAPPPRRGGIYWPFVPEASITEIGELTSGYRAALESDVVSWVSGPESVSASDHVIVSRYNKASVPAPPHARPVGVVANVTTVSVVRRVASQRDRRATLP